GQAARDCELGGLSNAVVDHFRWNLHGGFAGHEKDAAPIFFAHPGKIMPAETRAAEHVDLENPPPGVVCNLIERFRLENSKAVDENIDAGKIRCHPCALFG